MLTSYPDINRPACLLSHNPPQIIEATAAAGMTGKTIQRTFPLADIACFACRGWVQRQTEGAVVNHELTWLKIKPQGTDTTVIPLSGGNQQRVAVAKWLSMRPRLFVFNNPTRGIAGEGAGILMIFSDLEKVPGILDRASV